MQNAVRVVLLVVASVSAAVVTLADESKSPVLSTSASIVHGGIERTYRLYVPEGAGPFPLVVVLHPLSSTGMRMERYTHFSKLAQEENFIVVYPNAIQKRWNDRVYSAHAIDDVGFIAALLDHIEATFSVDATRIYVTGASNGGTLANRLACDIGDRFAAAAPVIADVPYLVQLRAGSTEPMPILLINGTNDPFVRFSVLPGREKIGIVTAEQTAAFWVRKNGCTPPPTITLLPDIDPEDGTRIEERAYAAGPAGAEVIFYAVKGGGHTWPGAPDRLTLRIYGKTSQDMDATKVIWKFFQKHHLTP